VHVLIPSSSIGTSISNPLHILEQDLLAVAIVKLRCSTIGMTGYPLGHLQSAIWGGFDYLL
jgi:hypothetical protein